MSKIIKVVIASKYIQTEISLWTLPYCVIMKEKWTNIFRQKFELSWLLFVFTGSVEITEAYLVRDILYVFQGIDGKIIKMFNSENCYKVDAKVLLTY